MACLEILTVSLILAVAVNSVACSSDEIQSDIEVTIVPDITEFLTQNPGLEAQPLLNDTKLDDVSRSARIVYYLGYRTYGNILILNLFQFSRKSLH